MTTARVVRGLCSSGTPLRAGNGTKVSVISSLSLLPSDFKLFIDWVSSMGSFCMNSPPMLGAKFAIGCAKASWPSTGAFSSSTTVGCLDGTSAILDVARASVRGGRTIFDDTRLAKEKEGGEANLCT